MKMFAVISPISAEKRMKELMEHTGILINEDGMNLTDNLDLADAIMYTLETEAFCYGRKESGVVKQEIKVISMHNPSKVKDRIICDWLSLQDFRQVKYITLLDLDYPNVEVRGYVSHKANTVSWVYKNGEHQDVTYEEFIGDYGDTKSYLEDNPNDKIIKIDIVNPNTVYLETEENYFIDLVLGGKNQSFIVDLEETNVIKEEIEAILPYKLKYNR